MLIKKKKSYICNYHKVQEDKGNPSFFQQISYELYTHSCLLIMKANQENLVLLSKRMRKSTG